MVSWLHDVHLFNFIIAIDGLGSGADNLPVVLSGHPPQCLVPVDVAVGQHHGLVVLVQGLPAHVADQAGLGAVSKREILGQLVQRFLADRALGVPARLGPSVALVCLEAGEPGLQSHAEDGLLGQLEDAVILRPELLDESLPAGILPQVVVGV